MPNFQGSFEYLAPDGATGQKGGCQLHFDRQTLTLTPETGAALIFDLGDIDAVTSAQWEVRLALYTGRTVVLGRFGKSFENLVHDLIESYRARTVQCLLLEDMTEVARFTANFELSGRRQIAGPAELRLYKTNLAVLAESEKSFQWRLADIDEVKIDSKSCTVLLQSGSDSLKLSHMAKRTEEFAGKLHEAIEELATHTAQALHTLLPFLDPDQVGRCASFLRDGHSASLAKLRTIHEQIPAALAANAVDKDLKPYHEQLATHAAKDMVYAGFKLILPDSADNAMADRRDTSDEPSSPETLYWFFFPLSQPGKSELANVVAWEASSRFGRATYFFRLIDPSQAAQLADPLHASSMVESSVQRLNSLLAMLNFRRRPIYVSDDELALNPQFRRYAIAARRLPEVREIRSRFLGRVLHSSPEAWQQQVIRILVEGAS